MRLASLRRRPGFSLIELVVVLMILAIVSGLTVAVVDWMRTSADKASASNVMGSLLSNIQLYKTTLNKYPDQFDSLLDDKGTALYSKLHSELSGERLTVDAGLSGQELESLNDVFITTVMDHDATSSFPGNSATIARVLATGGKVAVLKDGEVIDSIYPPTAGGASGSGLTTAMAAAGTTIKLVVFGFGPKNTAIGKTIVAPPIYSGVGDPSQLYARFLCVFAVYGDGRNAQLKAILDSKGDFLTEELTEFYQNTPK